MPGKCCFRDSWICSTGTSNDQDVAVWLRSVPDDKYKAHCILCNTSFDVSHSGFGSVKSHEKGKKHKDFLSALNCGKQTTLKFSLMKNACDTSLLNSVSENNPSSKVGDSTDHNSGKTLERSSPMSNFCIKDSVWKAEILWALNKVMHHSSDRAAASASDLFSVMFPDSLIARQFSMHKDKLGYLITFGLGPYFQNKLCETLKKCAFFSLSIDESLNSIAQKKQMDFIVKFWDNNLELTSTRYLTSAFLGHSTAADLLSSFNCTLNELGLPLSKLLQIAVDGPNVNLKFIKDFKSCMLLNNDTDVKKEIIDTGTCSLHTVHNSYKTAHNSSNWNIHQFLRCIYYLFKDFPSRRSDYTNASGSSLFPLKFCTIRWIENALVIDRAVKILPHLKKYVDFVKNNPPVTNNFNSLKEYLKDPLLEAKLSFLQSVALEIEPFLRAYQTDAPMLPFLYNDVYIMLRSVANRFVKHEVMKNIKNCYQLVKLDIHQQENIMRISNIDIGFGAKKSCRGVKEIDVTVFKRDCSKFLKTIFEKLIGPKCPVHKKLVKGASCLSPYIMLSDSLRLGRVTLALEELSLTEHITAVEADTIKKYYLTLCDDLVVKDKLQNYKTSCRIDTFLFEILNNRSEQCQPMFFFCKLIFCIFHGNAAVERGFSVNKECLLENMSENSLIAQRSVYSGTVSAGGLQNVEINSSLLQAAKLASSRRKLALEKKKNDAVKDAVDLKAAQNTINELNLKKKKILLQAEEEAAALEQEILMAKKKLKTC